MSKGKKIHIFIVFGIIIIMSLYTIPVIYTANLNTAIKENNEVKVKSLLKIKGNINRYNSFRMVGFFGNTPLQQACIQGNPVIIRMLLEQGARIDTEEWTPLTLALTCEYPEKYQVVKLLIDYGAKFDEGKYPPIFMLLAAKYDYGKGMGIIAKKDYNTQEEIYKLFLLLVESGASLDPSTRLSGYQIPYIDMILYCTVYQENMKILKYLVEEKVVDLNAKLLNEDTAIMIAVKNNDKEMVEYLLSQKVNRNMMNVEGKNVTDIAEELGNEEMIQLLK